MFVLRRYRGDGDRVLPIHQHATASANAHRVQIRRVGQSLFRSAVERAIFHGGNVTGVPSFRRDAKARRRVEVNAKKCDRYFFPFAFSSRLRALRVSSRFRRNRPQHHSPFRAGDAGQVGGFTVERCSASNV